MYVHPMKNVEVIKDSKKIEAAANDLAVITGQHPVVIKAKRSIATFKLRQGMQIGCKVTVLDGEGRKERYFLVGSAEAQPGAGRISNESPMGKALLGHQIGDDVEVPETAKQ